MLRVLRFQAEIAGLVGPASANHARLWPMPHEDELGEIEAGEAEEAGTEPGLLAEAVRSGLDRAERALARHRACREEMEAQEGFDGAAHVEAARRFFEAVEERERLPVCFEPPAPASADDLPLADGPPEETYEDDPWTGGEDAGDDDRADGAEHDWLYQRRNGCAEIYDPWAPEEVEERRRDRLEWEARRCGSDPLDLDDEGWTGEECWAGNTDSAPDHDRT